MRKIPFLILALVEFFSFGVFAPRLGFYHDDWANLERLSNAGSLWGGIRYYAGLILERPVESLQYPLLFALGGMNPLPYQLFYIAAETLQGWLLFVLFERLTGRRAFALLASAVILIFPTHAITHLWLSSAALVVTVDLTLASLILHWRWTENGRRRDLAAAQALYLVGVLNYEVAAFLPLMLAGALLGRSLEDGAPFLKAASSRARQCLPYAATLGAALLWQRAVVSLILHRNPRAVGLSLAHVLRVYEVGAECATNRVVDVCHRMLPVAWKGLGPAAAAGALILAAAAAALLARA